MKTALQKRIFTLHADICKALANPKRLVILNTLRNGEKSAGELVQILKIRKSNLSQHLSILRQNRIVVARREGTNIYYKISNSKIIKACDLMRQVLFEQYEEMKNLYERR